jgi:hypothetical protein
VKFAGIPSLPGLELINLKETQIDSLEEVKKFATLKSLKNINLVSKAVCGL